MDYPSRGSSVPVQVRPHDVPCSRLGRESGHAAYAEGYTEARAAAQSSAVAAAETFGESHRDRPEAEYKDGALSAAADIVGKLYAADIETTAEDCYESAERGFDPLTTGVDFERAQGHLVGTFTTRRTRGASYWPRSGTPSVGGPLTCTAPRGWPDGLVAIGAEGAGSGLLPRHRCNICPCGRARSRLTDPAPADWNRHGTPAGSGAFDGRCHMRLSLR